MQAENGNFESGLAKNGSLRKEKLHFTNKISSLQKLNVKKESYQVPGLYMGRGKIYPAQNHTMSTPKMPLLCRKYPKTILPIESCLFLCLFPRTKWLYS